MIKLRVGDTVKIISGKDRGREGKIEKVYPRKNSVLIQGINIYKKHVKGTQGQKGGIYDVPRPLSFAKIALVCTRCKKVTRVGLKTVGGEKIRVCRKCGREIDTKIKPKRKK